MHSLEIYSIRVHDRCLPGRLDDRYSILSDLRGHNLLDILENCFAQASADYVDLRETVIQRNPGADLTNVPRRVYKCSNIERTGNHITGHINVGEYGTKNDIVNRVSGNTIGEVLVDDSVIRDHFFYIELRPGERQGILLLQAIRGKGAKGILEDIVQTPVREVTGGLFCQIRPLAHRGLVNDWYDNAMVCEIRMSRFANNDPLNDLADRLGDTYSEIKIKPKSRRARLGRLADLDTGLIDIMRERAHTVKAQVEYNGRKRLFQLGVDDEPVSSVELNEEDNTIIFEDGNPTIQSTKQFSINLTTDIWPVITGGE